MSQTQSDGGAQPCANCHHTLDATDKFCRECGLPTLRQAQAQPAVPMHPPGTLEPRPGLEVVPDPQPFVRQAPDPTLPVEASAELTTSGVAWVTSPPMATPMAISTVIMAALIATFLVLAFRT